MGDLLEIALTDYFETTESNRKRVMINASTFGLYGVDDLKRIQAAVETAILILENDLIL
jgi:hypothetical protein